jgi:hypothetical protein
MTACDRVKTSPSSVPPTSMTAGGILIADRRIEEKYSSRPVFIGKTVLGPSVSSATFRMLGLSWRYPPRSPEPLILQLLID